MRWNISPLFLYLFHMPLFSFLSLFLFLVSIRKEQELAIFSFDVKFLASCQKFGGCQRILCRICSHLWHILAMWDGDGDGDGNSDFKVTKQMFSHNSRAHRVSSKLWSFAQQLQHNLSNEMSGNTAISRPFKNQYSPFIGFHSLSFFSLLFYSGLRQLESSVGLQSTIA